MSNTTTTLACPADPEGDPGQSSLPAPGESQSPEDQPLLLLDSQGDLGQPLDLTLGDSPSEGGQPLPLHDSRVLCEEVQKQLADSQPVIPELDLTYIQSVVACTNEADGESRVEEKAGSDYDARNLSLLGGLQGSVRPMQRDVIQTVAAVMACEVILKDMRASDPIIPKRVDPLTGWEKAYVGVLCTAAAGMLFVGINNVSLLLQNSGIAGFESWIRCALWSTVALGLAWCIESMRAHLRPYLRKRFATAVSLLGLITGGTWCWYFAKTFGGITLSLSDLLAQNALTASGTAANADPKGTILIFTGLLAEALVAGGLVMTAHTLVESKSNVSIVPNKEHALRAKELKFLSIAHRRKASLLGQLRGRIEEHVAARKSHVAAALERFRALRAMRTQQESFAKALNP